MKEKKGKLRNLFDKNILLGIIIMLVICAVVTVVLLIPVAAWQDGTGYMTAIAGVLMLLIFCRIYKGEYLGSVKGGDVKVGLQLACVMLIYYGFIMLQTTFLGKWQTPTVRILGNAMAAGTFEEALFRGFLMSYLLKFRKEEKDIPVVLILCSVVFGLAHAANIFAGGSFGITMIQALATIGQGAVFGAVYMRSGNIVIAMFAHGITDFLCFLDIVQTAEKGAMIAEVRWNNVLDLAICAGLFVFALYLVRPAKRSEIKELWDRKWNRAGE